LPRKTPGEYKLTAQIEATYAGGPVVCLAIQARGRSYKLHAERPRFVLARDRVLAPRADAIGPDGTPIDVDPAGSPVLSRISIVGGLETTAGYHDECGGWSDGYDAIAERMCAALAEGDVLLTVDSPGGAVIGLAECVDSILAAKARHGRKITTIIGPGMGASAGAWLPIALTDPGELYITRSSMMGSIAARASHVNEAGALALAGVEITDIASLPGKIALSPNRAPTAAGLSRATRDVMIAHRAFVSAVALARGLSVKAIEAIDGDMLTGSAAVAAGLADAVAPVEDVERWALYRAATPGAAMADDTKAEGEMPPGKPGESPAEKASECKRCGEMPGDEARYCMKCGTKVGAEMPDEDPEDDEAPESSKPAARLAPTGATAATMLGLRSDASEVAIKTALAAVLSERDHVRKVLGASDLHSVKGKLRAQAEDVAEGVKAKRDLAKERAANEKRERIDGLLALSARLGATNPELSRGSLIRDVMGKDDADNDVVIGIEPNPSSLIANAPIKEFRSYVASKLANAGEPRADSPFEAARDAARERATGATVTQADLETAQRFGRDPKDVAASRAALFPTSTGAPRALIGG